MPGFSFRYAPRAKNGPRTNVNQQLPFLAQREAVSPSMTVAATAPRRPCSADSSVLGRHISITMAAGKPSAKSKQRT